MVLGCYVQRHTHEWNLFHCYTRDMHATQKCRNEKPQCFRGVNAVCSRCLLLCYSPFFRNFPAVSYVTRYVHEGNTLITPSTAGAYVPITHTTSAYSHHLHRITTRPHSHSIDFVGSTHAHSTRNAHRHHLQASMSIYETLIHSLWWGYPTGVDG